MIHYKIFILILIIECCMTFWVPVYREGLDANLTLNSNDIGELGYCEVYGYPIITSDSVLEKTISLKNNKPFAHTKVLIDFIYPQNNQFEIAIQDKVQTSFSVFDDDYLMIVQNDCYDNYVERTLHYEIYGNSVSEIKIQIERIQSLENYNIQKNSKLPIAIKQIHILQIQCSENCQRCVYDSKMHLQCSTCNDGFLRQNDQCLCDQYIQSNKCVEQCDFGFVADVFKICQQGEIVIEKYLLNQKQQMQISDNIEISSQTTKSSHYYYEIDMIVENFQLQQSISFYFGKTLFAFLFKDGYESTFKHYIQIKETKIDQTKSNFQITLPLTETLDNSTLISAEFRDYTPKKNWKDNKQAIKTNTLFTINSIKQTEVEIMNQICSQQNCIKCSRVEYKETCIQCHDSMLIYNGQCVRECPKNSKLVQNFCIIDQQIKPYQSVIDQFNFIDEDSYQLGFYKLNANQIQYLFRSENYIQKYLNPHYAITVASTITFIDYFQQAKFRFAINEDILLQVTPNDADTKQFEGDSSLPDSKVEMQEYILHSNSSLLITSSCQGALNCYVSNLKIFIHQCHPYCQTCTGPKLTECLKFGVSTQGFDTKLQKCLFGYHMTENEICEMCPAYCASCFDQFTCLQCAATCKLSNSGKCLCN